MNIFYLDKEPKRCAEYHCDRHICKMVIEYTQILSTAHRMLDGKPYIYAYKRYEGYLDDFEMNIHLYKPTHINHPVTKWAMKSHKNYLWLLDLLEACLNEYQERYNKEHACKRKFKYLEVYPKKITRGNFTPPPQCMPDDCKGPNTVKSYRRYYKKHKMKFAKWNYSPKPDWI